MPPNPINQYLAALRGKYKGGDATERSYYSALEALLEASGSGIRVVSEPKRRACGAVDFQVKHRDLPIGHIEAKDLGSSLDAAEEDEQIKDRYRKALPNLILTNFLEFRWYVNGEHRKTIRLGEVADHRKLKTTHDGRAELTDLLKSFLSQEAQGAADAKDLAVRLARFAHGIRDVIVRGFALNHVSADLGDLRDAVKQELIPDLTDERFADLFSQTLAYGFFAAWVHHPDGKPFLRAGAASDIPKTNPFLRRLFDMTTGAQLESEPFAGYVDDLVQLLRSSDKAETLEDFARATGRADPVVHFYETFLQEYDPKIRELRGVYYTPEPVVSYMVRSVDHLLKTHFGLPKGLADTAQAEYEVESEKGEKLTKTGPRVLILDPACGTGTFLFEIVNHIREEYIRKRQSGAWSSYVREHLLPRLFGFELLMAPYAMAHLKLGLQLAGQDLDEPARSSYAYDFEGDERLGVYLTNTLEEAARKAETLFGPLRVITQEANAAAEIKRDKPIMVVIGNPPYSGHSANRGPWMNSLIEDYKKGHPELHKPAQAKWLHDDYVKFIRFGQWRIERSGGGILALITNHSYLDNPTFRGMRQQLMQAFTDIYILDLHGNSRKKEVCPDGSKDENVFDIQQGVAIAIFVRESGVDGPARVWHADLWGLRDFKEAHLAAREPGTVSPRRIEPRAPDFLFVPQNAELHSEYGTARPLPEAMDQNGDPAPGIVTTQDDFAISWTAEEAVDKVHRLLETASENEARSLFHLCSQSQWDYKRAKRELPALDLQERLTQVLYRPFDVRWSIWDRNVAVHRRLRVMDHMRRRGNMGLCVGKAGQVVGGQWTLVTCATTVEDFNLFYRGGNCNFPLYLYPEERESAISRDQRIHEAQQQLAKAGGDATAQKRLADTIRHLFPHPEYPRWPNFDPLLLTDLEERLGLKFVPDGAGDLKKTFGPEDVFSYIYAILHSPTYRARYAEFLKRDFPRIPFTSDPQLFAKLADKGAELVALHLLESDLLSGVQSELTGDGDNKVDRVRYDAKDHRVYINKTQHFPYVPSDVWSFKVGGYQVCDKWLKDRKGRPLSYADQEHYTKVTVALRETIRLMQEIDQAIPSWPIT